jgi:hypothetical protein
MGCLTIEDLKPFLDAGKVFLKGAHTIDDCIFESTESQKILARLNELKIQHNSELNKLKNDFDYEISQARDVVMNAYIKRSVKFTDKMLDYKIPVVVENWIEKKTKIDDSETISSVIDNLIMIYMQRKSIIQELISYWKNKKEIDSCLMKNREFLERVAIYGNIRKN